MHHVKRAFVFTSLSVMLFYPFALAFAQTPNDTYFGDQWYLQKIGAPAAWDTTVGSRDITIAVLDTAIELDHPDLEQNLYVNAQEIPDNGIDDDRNGYIDDVHGWDFVENDADVNPSPSEVETGSALALSHGTFVSGVIGAVSNNHAGYAGVAWNARIMPLRILNADGAGEEMTAIRAIDYAVKNGARVVNLSFAGDTAGPAFADAIRRAHEAGVVIVAALGNDGRNVNEEPVYPACLRGQEEDWVIGVSATDDADAETQFTNFGNTCADLSAPGVDMYGLHFLKNGESQDDLQLKWSGTSAASPLVAGAAALILAAYPQLTADQVRTALKLSVDPIVETLSGRGALGVGRLNIAKALGVAASIAGTAPLPPRDVSDTASNTTENKNPGSSTANLGVYAKFSFLALGAVQGDAPFVRVLTADGEERKNFLAYAEGFRGGVNLDVNDFDGDGTPEIVTGAGSGGGPHVRVFAVDGTLLHEFFAYEASLRKGVEVAIADFDGDGVLDILTAVDADHDVIIWTEDGQEKFRFHPEGFAPGTPITARIADVDDDWETEIVLAAKAGAPRVAIYNDNGKELVNFLAYGENMTRGLSLAVGDFDGDSRDEIVTAPLSGAPGHIRVFNKIGALWGEFFVTDQQSTLGARVATADLNIDGEKEIVLVPAGGAGDVRVYSAKGEFLSSVGTGLIGPHGATLGAW